MERTRKKKAWRRRLILTALGLLAALGLGRLYGRHALVELAEAAIRRHFPEVPQTTTAELAARLEDRGGAPLLVDARAREEYAVSHLPGAIHVEPSGGDLSPLEGVARDRPIVVYCSLGYRSSQLVERLRAAGFTEVSNLEGSIFVWANEGRPLYRGDERVREVHPYGEPWGTLFLDPARVAAVEAAGSDAPEDAARDGG